MAFQLRFKRQKDFPCGSAGKESACNSGDPGLIPGMGKSPGEGIGYPLQYSWVIPYVFRLKCSLFSPAVCKLGQLNGKDTSSIMLLIFHLGRKH